MKITKTRKIVFIIDEFISHPIFIFSTRTSSVLFFLFILEHWSDTAMTSPSIRGKVIPVPGISSLVFYKVGPSIKLMARSQPYNRRACRSLDGLYRASKWLRLWWRISAFHWGKNKSIKWRLKNKITASAILLGFCKTIHEGNEQRESRAPRVIIEKERSYKRAWCKGNMEAGWPVGM